MRRSGQAEITQAGEVRSSSLESLRALAALGVLFGHVYGQSRHYAPAATLNTFWHRVLFGGGFGVFIFFALTGYLLFWPFARHLFGSAPPVDLRRYAINRALRILPLYLVAVLVLLALQGDSLTLWWRFLTLTQSYSVHTISAVDGPMWSLVVEIHFYVLLPVLCLALAVIARRSPLRAAVILVALAAASWVARHHAVGGATRHILLEYSLPATFMYFVPGMLLALLRLRWAEGRPRWLRGPLASADAWLAVAAAFAVLQFRDYSRSTLIAIAGFLAVGACVLPLSRGPLVRALEWRPLAVLGVASYSLYIWHDPIVIRLGTLAGIGHGYLTQVAIAVPVCVIVALISYRLIEAPFLRLRKPWSPAAAPRAPRAGAVTPERPAAVGIDYS